MLLKKNGIIGKKAVAGSIAVLKAVKLLIKIMDKYAKYRE
jgi:hypothetical protein